MNTRYINILNTLNLLKCNIKYYIFCKNNNGNEIINYFNSKVHEKLKIFNINKEDYFTNDPKNIHHFKLSNYWNNIIPYIFNDLNIDFDKNLYKLINQKDSRYQYDLSYHEKIYDNNKYSFLSFFNSREISNVDHFQLFRTDKNISTYHSLCIDTHRSYIINSTLNNNKVLILVVDSMATPIIPILGYYFKTILVFDNIHRAYRYMDLLESIIQYKPTHFIGIYTEHNFNYMFDNV